MRWFPPTNAAAVVAFPVKENIKIQKWRERVRERAWHQTERCMQQCIVGRSPPGRPRPKITADLPPKLLMSNISPFPRSLSLLSHMLARPGSQPPLWIRFHSLHCVVMETRIWVLHHFSSVMVAAVRRCNLCSQCRLQRQKQGPESHSAFSPEMSHD